MAGTSDPNARMMPNDIDTFAHYVEGIDPSRYFDSQAKERLDQAMNRWPLLAAVLYPQPAKD